LALKDGDDISKLVNDGDYFGFPVDAGLGGFFDYRSGIEYNNFSRWFEKEHPGENIYDGLLEKEFKKSALEPNNPNDCGDWLNFTIPNTDFNVTMFQSGYGDGHYPAYWG